MAKKNEPSTKQEILNQIFAYTPSVAEERMIDIVEAYISILAKSGSDRATYQEIAKKAKVSRPLVHHYFPEFESIWELTIKYIRASLQKHVVEAIQKHTSAKDQLEAYIDANIDWTQKFPTYWSAWVYFYYRTTFNPKDAALNRELVLVGLKRIEGLLVLGNQNKVFKCKNPLATARTIQILITGTMVSLATEGNLNSLDELKKSLKDRALEWLNQ